MNELLYWIDKQELENLYTADYWNNIEQEKKKAWWVEDENDTKLIKHLQDKGLKEEFDLAISNSDVKGKVLDLAAGTCWTSALLSKMQTVDEIDAVEFSFHRINDLAPKTIRILGGNEDKINRILGSFYDIKKDDGYYDAVVLSQAYHHAQYPLKLFNECDRVLKKGGTIIIIGEHIISKQQVLKRFIKNLLKGRLSLDIHEEFYNHNDPLGDHSYMINDYKFTFYAYGYSYKMISSNIKKSTIFVGKKL